MCVFVSFLLQGEESVRTVLIVLQHRTEARRGESYLLLCRVQTLYVEEKKKHRRQQEEQP